jgi:predicted alpha/beta hydrolase family esterase
VKNALILHGAGNNSQGNWFPWLRNELEKQGYQVWVPDLPGTDKPDVNLWLETIYSNKNWIFSEDTVVVGHSAGATLIFRILEKLPPKIVIGKSILVAGPVKLGTKPEYFQYKISVVKEPFNWKKIKQSCRKFYFFYSDNDPYECGIDNWDIIHKSIDGVLVFRPGEGHFNLEKGPQYKQFPELLKKII